MAQRAWAGNTFGSRWMHQKLIVLLRHSDVRIWYAFAAIFIVPFCLVASRGARESFHYFRRRQGCGRVRALGMTYVNHVLFSQVVIDKFALYAGKRMGLQIVGYDVFRQMTQHPEGFVMLSSHIGCYEMAGYELVSDRKPFHALVYGGEKETVMDNRQRLFSDNNIRMITVNDDMSHLLQIDRALAAGEIVSLPADRFLSSRRHVAVNLLGAEARLPMGPFAVAPMRSLDVVTVNVMKTSVTGYTAYVTPLPYNKQGTRHEQVVQLAQGYADELTRLLRQYPAQWYNYFDFWDDNHGL